jgi:3-methylcrotonyl-CoA carboxylase alpha subunit
LALSQYEAVGVQTNLELLRRIAAHPDFAAGELDTGFIGRHEAALLPPAVAAPATALIAAAAHVAGRPAPTGSGDPFSPWSAGTSWRMNAVGYREVVLRDGGDVHTIRVTGGRDGAMHYSAPGIVASAVGGTVLVDGIAMTPRVVGDGDALTVVIEGRNWPLIVVDPLAAPVVDVDGSGRVVAPMPGRVIAVAVVPGQSVIRGEVLLVLEAMKVQMRLTAPRDGVVAGVSAVAGELVEDGVELVVYQV